MARNPFSGKRRQEQAQPPTPGRTRPVGFEGRTPEQAKAALEAAKMARAETSELLTLIRDGDLSLAALLSGNHHHSERIQRLLVPTLLRSLPGADRKQVKLLAALTDGQRVGKLTDKQRAALIEWYGE